MDGINWVRPVHRWLSIAFTVAVIVNTIVVMRGGYIVWVGLLALGPLILLMITGLYMFVRPYVVGRRGGPA